MTKDCIEIDWQTASRSFSIIGPKTIVELFPIKESSIMLPDSVKDKMQPNMGVVLKSSEFDAGTVVALVPGTGVMYDAAELGDYRPKNRIAVLGVWAEYFGHPDYCDVHEQILFTMENGQFKALKDKIFLIPDRSDRTDGGILLLNEEFTGKATLGPCGPESGAQEGMRVTFNQRFVREHGYDVEGTDYKVCTSEAIMWVD